MITQSRSTVMTELLRRIQAVIWNRRFVITDGGAFGLVPANAQMGDMLMVLYGLSVPVVLRKLHNSYWLVGECYIDGAMDGLKPILPGVPTFRAGLNSSTGNLDATVNAAQIVSLR
jgi:hypothetical protein